MTIEIPLYAKDGTVKGRALDNNQDLGSKIVDAVRAAYDRADD